MVNKIALNVFLFLCFILLGCSTDNVSSLEFVLYSKDGKKVPLSIEKKDDLSAQEVKSEDIIGKFDQIMYHSGYVFFHSVKSEYVFYKLNLESGNVKGFGIKGRGANEVNNAEFCRIVDVFDSSLVYYDFSPVLKELHFDTGMITSYLDIAYLNGSVQNLRFFDKKMIATGRFEKGHVVFGHRDNKEFALGGWKDLEYMNNIELEGSKANFIKPNLSVCPTTGKTAMTNMNINDVLVYNEKGELENKIIVNVPKADRNTIYYQNVISRDELVYGLFNGKSTSIIRDLLLSSPSQVHVFNTKTGNLSIYLLDQFIRDFDLISNTNKMICLKENDDEQPLVIYELLD